MPVTNVAIIDDDKHLADTLTEALQYHGCTVHHFYNETDATAYLETNHVDWIICDWDLGPHTKLNGSEIINQLKELISRQSPNSAPKGEIKYVLFSGLHRETPPNVYFFLKSHLLELVDLITQRNILT